MLKYIGDFEKLNDYGIVPIYNTYTGAVNGYAKKWGHNNYLKILNLDKTFIAQFDSSYDRRSIYSKEYVEEILYDLIKDGLVIKETKLTKK